MASGGSIQRYGNAESVNARSQKVLSWGEMDLSTRWGPSGGLGIVGLILIVMLLFYLFGGGPYFHRW